MSPVQASTEGRRRQLSISSTISDNSTSSELMFDVPDTDDHINLPTTEDPEKLVYSDTLSILFGNVDGLSKKKADKLKILSDQDHFLCLNELNYK